MVFIPRLDVQCHLFEGRAVIWRVSDDLRYWRLIQVLKKMKLITFKEYERLYRLSIEKKGVRSKNLRPWKMVDDDMYWAYIKVMCCMMLLSRKELERLDSVSWSLAGRA
jgi:hypothetical protein